MALDALVSLRASRWLDRTSSRAVREGNWPERRWRRAPGRLCRECTGSNVVTPKSCAWMNRPRTRAAARPKRIPATDNPSARPTIIRTTSPGSAPSAMRILISRRPLRHGVAHDAEDTGCREHERDERQRARAARVEPRAGHRADDELRQRRDVGDRQVRIERPDLAANRGRDSGWLARRAHDEPDGPDCPLRERHVEHRTVGCAATSLQHVADDADDLARDAVDVDALAQRVLVRGTSDGPPPR